MKITDVETYVVGTPPPHEGGLYWVFLKLTTDSGIAGFGEAYSVPFHPRVVARMIEDVCQRQVIGKASSRRALPPTNTRARSPSSTPCP